MIPKIQETKASITSPRVTTAKRSLRSFGLVRVSSSGGPGGGEQATLSPAAAGLAAERLLALADRLIGLLALACPPGLLRGVPIVGRARAPRRRRFGSSPFAESCSGPDVPSSVRASAGGFVPPVRRGIAGGDWSRWRPTTHLSASDRVGRAEANPPPSRAVESSIGPVTPPPLETLTRGAVDVLPEGRLAEQLGAGRALRVKLGIDPTARTSTSATAWC